MRVFLRIFKPELGGWTSYFEFSASLKLNILIKVSRLSPCVL